MARIKNTGVPNIFGEGYEQELELDNGKRYRIKNTGVPNIFGEGYEQEIQEIKTYSNNTPMSLFSTIITWICLIPIIIFGLLLVFGAIYGILSAFVLMFTM